MVMISLLDSCGAGIEAWKLDCKVVLLARLPLWPLVSSWECISYLFSQRCCAVSQTPSGAHIRSPCSWEPGLAWPLCAHSWARWGSSWCCGCFTSTRWLCSSRLGSLSCLVTLKAEGSTAERFLSLAVFFLWSFFHRLYDLHGISSVPSVVLIVIVSASVTLCCDSSSL